MQLLVQLIFITAWKGLFGVSNWSGTTIPGFSEDVDGPHVAQWRDSNSAAWKWCYTANATCLYLEY